MNEKKALSHHEEIRYNYLLQNLTYLNDEQREEFDYLHNKKEGYIEEEYYDDNVPIDEEQYDQDYDYDHFEEDNLYEEEEYYPEEDIEPVYDSSDDSNQEYDFQNWDDEPYMEEVQNVHDGMQEPLDYSDNPGKKTKVTAKAKSKKVAVSSKKKPKKKLRLIRRVFAVLGIVALLFVILISFQFYRGVNLANTDLEPSVTEVFNGEDTEDGINILILGNDKRVSQDTTDARTDSIMVMNINNSDGDIKLVSFLRDTLINIEGESATMNSLDHKLNSSFNIGELEGNQGAEYVRQALKKHYDINIKYYVMVDFETFADVINRLFPEGVEIDADFGTMEGETIEIAKVPDYANEGNVPNPIQEISRGNQIMDGRTLLNYARFRDADDFDLGRTRRQQQVIETLVNELKSPSKLFSSVETIGMAYSLTSTNLPLSEIFKDGLSVVRAKDKGIVHQSIPEAGEYEEDYDYEGGSALLVDFDKYQDVLADLKMR